MFSNRGHNSIAVFSLTAERILTPVQWIDCGGRIPRFFTLDPAGRKLFCCNQFSESISISISIFIAAAGFRQAGDFKRRPLSGC